MNGATTAAAKSVGWLPASKIGAKLGPLMKSSYYPTGDEDLSERVRSTVRLSKQQHEDIELIAEIWNALDKALERHRGRKWKANAVIEQLITVGIAGFWGEVGGRPDSKEGRAMALERIVGRIRRDAVSAKK